MLWRNGGDRELSSTCGPVEFLGACCTCGFQVLPLTERESGACILLSPPSPKV